MKKKKCIYLDCCCLNRPFDDLGIEALTEKLGPIGMVDFIQQFDSGYGDYTKDRHNWLNDLSIEDISEGIKNRE